MDPSSFYPWPGTSPGSWFYPWTGPGPGPWFFPQGTPAVHGTFTLFGQPASPAGAVLANDTNPYTLGMQFTCSETGTLNGIWWYSIFGALNLPTSIALFQVSGGGSGTLVHSETATWSGAAASGWVLASFSSAPSLTAGQAYKGCVLNTDVAAQNWYSSTSHYWDTGAGAGGITSGPLSAPNNAGGDGGQDCFNASATLAYPATSFNAGNYWVDVKVTV